MGKNKLSKYADMATFKNVVQADYKKVGNQDYELKGNWQNSFFKNHNPIILELGCGKGEYTIGLAETNKNQNFIGIDIKEARMWKGAKYALENGLSNVGFIRTQIEIIKQFFAPSEVSEIWLTFPDPQMKRTKKRLTSTRFIELYRDFLVPGGIIHLKTDSNFQYQYTLEMAKINGFEIVNAMSNIYDGRFIDPVLNIKTYYENQWLERDIKIKYISFIPHQNKLIEPNIDIEPDTYRSFGRGVVTIE
ncbi:MAG TPA: tRNA (guanosine(46)-N7)-methyltransferase TrmB [Prolixibacteraceae bacterium]|nr:tRNA (guanosine(46)-N7)-methyltransferase TrmB [Prolixibacteraceae bacterium]